LRAHVPAVARAASCASGANKTSKWPSELPKYRRMPAGILPVMTASHPYSPNFKNVCSSYIQCAITVIRYPLDGKLSNTCKRFDGTQWRTSLYYKTKLESVCL